MRIIFQSNGQHNSGVVPLRNYELLSERGSKYHLHTKNTRQKIKKYNFFILFKIRTKTQVSYLKI
jgi:hypothetical protein